VTPIDQHMLVPRGPQAAEIASLWWFYLAVVTVVVLLVWAFVLVALIRRRDGDATPALDEETLAEVKPAQPVRTLPRAGERRRLQWVSGFTGLTVVTLLVLLVESVASGDRIASLSRQHAVHIELTGHRWWWGARYMDDQDHSKIFATANELHIPVGRPVELTLRSADVIHSFWVPNLSGKRDLIPGRTTHLLLRADQAGTYRGQCAEFCGHAHAEMALSVVAEPQAKYEAWAAQQRQNAPDPSSPEAQRGRDVFMSGPCVMCHSIAGTPAQSGQGPDLTHVASRKRLAAETLPNTRGHLAGWVLNAPNLKPGTQMPSITLPADDLHALLAYLETLR
jgi:cytochrome c oxidase subunit II